MWSIGGLLKKITNYLGWIPYTSVAGRTTREQTLERCPNLALASAFFAPGTKGSCPTVVRGAGIFSPGWYYQLGLKVTRLVIPAGTKAFSPGLGDAPGLKIPGLAP